MLGCRSSGPIDRFGVAATFKGVSTGGCGALGGGERAFGREFGGVWVALGTGEGEDLGTEDGGGTMHFTEVCQRKLEVNRMSVDQSISPSSCLLHGWNCKMCCSGTR